MELISSDHPPDFHGGRGPYAITLIGDHAPNVYSISIYETLFERLFLERKTSFGKCFLQKVDLL